MTAYENDVLVIPKKFQKMTISELEAEEKKLLAKLKKHKPLKKEKTPNKNGIIYNI